MRVVEGSTWLCLQLLMLPGDLYLLVQGSKPLAASFPGRSQPHPRVQSFTQCMARCGLVDIPAKCKEVCAQGGKSNFGFKRVRREASVCAQVGRSKDAEGVLPPEDVSVKFNFGGNNSWFVNVTWKPFHDTKRNSSTWGGYILRYIGYTLVPSQPPLPQPLKCVALPKTQTYYVICESDDGWKYPEMLHFNVSTYPVYDNHLHLRDLTQSKPRKQQHAFGSV